jgi:hypothetical protein
VKIYLSIKELNSLVKEKVITTGAGEDVEKSCEDHDEDGNN